MMEQTQGQTRAEYQRDWQKAYRARQQPPAPAVALAPVIKPEPEKRAVQRPPWHVGMHRAGGTRFGDDDWTITPENDPLILAGGSFGKSHPAPR